MMKQRTTDTPRPLRSAGFSIIEVLVALLVLAIGLLGLAALQAQGLRFNHDAYVRTQATHLASDIIDRMRVNPENLADYTAADPDLLCDPTFEDLQGGTTIEMDLSCWYDAVEENLPGGSAIITANATANFYDVTVRWLDRTPRDFGGTVRVPGTAAECDAIAARFWDAGSGACLVEHTWTVWP